MLICRTVQSLLGHDIDIVNDPGLGKVEVECSSGISVAYTGDSAGGSHIVEKVMHVGENNGDKHGVSAGSEVLSRLVGERSQGSTVDVCCLCKLLWRDLFWAKCEGSLSLCNPLVLLVSVIELLIHGQQADPCSASHWTLIFNCHFRSSDDGISDSTRHVLLILIKIIIDDTEELCGPKVPGSGSILEVLNFLRYSDPSEKGARSHSKIFRSAPGLASINELLVFLPVVSTKALRADFMNTLG